MDSAAQWQRLYQSGVIAVLIVDRVEDAVPLAEALIEGGVDAIELTLRTPVALDALVEIRRKVPEILSGIGTILDVEQVKQVVDAGAAFGVAPGLNRDVVRAAQERSLPFSPGVVTPSEIEQAVGLGCRVLKFFPSEPLGGLNYLRAVAAPYDHLDLRYIPLGGIRVENMQSYLEERRILAVGGSWIASRQLIREQDWKTITDQAREAHEIVKQLRRV